VAGSRRRGVTLRLLAVALGLLVSALLAEGLTRVAWRAGWMGALGGPDQLMAQGRPWDVPWILRDREAGWVPRPGFDGVVSEPESRARLRVNRLGLRGPEPDPAGADQGRWLVVGDSFVLALQVEEQQAFPALLDGALPQQVLNGGVDDYSTWQATRWYQRVDSAIDVDTVVLLFFMGNDSLDNTHRLDFDHSVLPASLAGLTRAQVLQRRVGGLPPPLRSSQLLGRLSLWQSTWGRPSDDRWLMDEIVVEMVRLWLLEPAALEAHLAPTREALQELRDVAAARGDRLLVALAPPLFHVSLEDRASWLDALGPRGLHPSHQDFDATPRALATMLDELGIDGCDLAPILRQAEAAGEQAYLRYNRHWTPRGHELAAQAIRACVEALPPAAPQAPPATTVAQ
jgi:hypothetical protein